MGDIEGDPGLEYNPNELLEVICSTNIERQIAELRAQGHTDAEIGEQLEMSAQRVNAIR